MEQAAVCIMSIDIIKSISDMIIRYGAKAMSYFHITNIWADFFYVIFCFNKNILYLCTMTCISLQNGYAVKNA